MATTDKKPTNTIEDIPDQFLICRDLGHSWMPSDVKVSRKLGEIHRILLCRSCATQRVQILDMNGYRLRSKYVYPEDQDQDAAPYKLRGLGRLSADDRAGVRVMSTNNMKASARDGLKAVQ